MDFISFKQAKAAGLKHYFTGKPCKRGHICRRFVTSCACIGCNQLRPKVKNLARDRIWKEKNRERLKAMARMRYANHPEKHIKKVQAYYAVHHERIRKTRRERHFEAYKDPLVREQAAARTREWTQANPEKAKTNAINGKAKRKNVQGRHTAADIAEILELQKKKCAYCKTKLGKKYHIDHILAVSRGGTNDRANLQITCAPCNLSKWATDPIVFAQRQGRLL